MLLVSNLPTFKNTEKAKVALKTAGETWQKSTGLPFLVLTLFRIYYSGEKYLFQIWVLHSSEFTACLINLSALIEITIMSLELGM